MYIEGIDASGKFVFVDQLTVDTNGDGIPDAPDGSINGADRVVTGNGLPKFLIGFGNTLDL